MRPELNDLSGRGRGIVRWGSDDRKLLVAVCFESIVDERDGGEKDEDCEKHCNGAGWAEGHGS